MMPFKQLLTIVRFNQLLECDAFLCLRLLLLFTIDKPRLSIFFTFRLKYISYDHYRHPDFLELICSLVVCLYLLAEIPKGATKCTVRLFPANIIGGVYGSQNKLCSEVR